MIEGETELRIILSDNYYMTYLTGEHIYNNKKMYDNPFYRMFESTLVSEDGNENIHIQCKRKGLKCWLDGERESLIGFSKEFSKVCKNVKIATIIEIMTFRAEDAIPEMFLEIFEYNKVKRIIQELENEDN